MKFALLNPNWDFKGSTYFGCQDPHTPLELLFAAGHLLTAGHESSADRRANGQSYLWKKPGVAWTHSRLIFW